MYGKYLDKYTYKYVSFFIHDRLTVRLYSKLKTAQRLDTPTLFKPLLEDSPPVLIPPTYTYKTELSNPHI